MTAQNLSHEVCVYHHDKLRKDARAGSVHVRHASVEEQVQCVNVVIGVVLGEQHVVVRVHIPLVVCDDAVVRRTLVLIALCVIIVFVVAIFSKNFCCIGGILFTLPSVTMNYCWLLPNFVL